MSTKSAFSVYNERKNIIINYGRVHKRTLQMNKRNKRTNEQTYKRNKRNKQVNEGPKEQMNEGPKTNEQTNKRIRNEGINERRNK